MNEENINTSEVNEENINDDNITEESSTEDNENSENPKKDKENEAKWYVVHTYSGHENKVKVNVEKIVENRGFQDIIQKVHVPMEEVVEMKGSQKKVSTKKVFPGYVLVKMHLTDQSWYIIRNTNGVTGFVGPASKPVPLTEDEVRRFGVEIIEVDLDVKIGDNVRIINGPLERFVGVITEIDDIHKKLRVSVSMFGRETPIELSYSQVIKL